MRHVAPPLNLLGLLVLMILPALVVPRAAEAGVLELVDRQDDAILNTPTEVTVSPDGRYVYFGNSSRTLRFRRELSVGTLVFDDAGDAASSIEISPDGRSLYTCGGLAVQAHARDLQTGESQLVEEWDGSLAFGNDGGPYSLWLSPDARHVYVRLARGIAVFSRDATRGVLTWVQTIYDGVGEVEELVPTDLAFSADGRHVYVATADYVDVDGITVFSRDPDSGALAWRQFLSNDGNEALDSPRQMQVSQDGRNVYLIGDDGVVTLQRDADDGTVSFLEVDGLYGTKTLVAGPDDRFVYAFRSEYVETYSREAATGSLDLVDSFDLPILDLSDVRAAEFSPDGYNLYLATSHDSTLR